MLSVYFLFGDTSLLLELSHNFFKEFLFSQNINLKIYVHVYALLQWLCCIISEVVTIKEKCLDVFVSSILRMESSYTFEQKLSPQIKKLNNLNYYSLVDYHAKLGSWNCIIVWEYWYDQKVAGRKRFSIRSLCVTKSDFLFV